MILSALKTIPRDIRFLSRILKIKRNYKKAEKENHIVGKLFDDLAQKHPERPCFYFNDQVWTYKKLEQESNKIGNYFSNQGLRKNDVVSLLMENRVEYIATWLGLHKIGVVPALLNCNLTSEPLKHSVELTKPKAIICGYELSSALAHIYPKGETNIPVYGTGIGDRGILSKAIDIDSKLKEISTKTPSPSQPLEFDDDLFYIYTSGTTGLPKAAVFKQGRYILVADTMKSVIGMTSSDVFSTALPLYHSAAGVIGTGIGITAGIPVVIREKFSASHFWKECVKYNVTAAQYMGETCRYLLRQPIAPEEKQHKVRMMCGNGLRPEIWSEFQNRFNVPLLVEMYAATEGNCNLLNIFGKHSAVGFIPPLLQPFWPVNVIKLNEDEEPIRDAKTGLLVKAKIGEFGELVGQIQKGEPGREFTGYALNESATKQKILSDVFQKSDSAFRSGDMLMRDAEGYYYFKDRIGDTFRWKAENISTAQVESVITKLVKLQDVIVYGVQIPNCDGRAGMAAVADPNDEINLEDLAKGLISSLPSFARPLFLRVRHEIEMTGTHKMKKFPLQKDGIDLKHIGNDRIYFFDRTKFIPLTVELHAQIISGQIKL